MFSFPSPRHPFEITSLTAASSPLDTTLSSRSSQAANRARPVYRFGRCEVRVASREVLVDGQARPLQPRPFDLLICLIEGRDRVLHTNELLDEIWRQAIVQPGSLAAAITRVRKALGDTDLGVGQIIRTYPRVGYRFVAKLDGEMR